MQKWEHIQSKIVSAEEARVIISSWQDNGEKVVFTNGCFDILHRGHVTYLAKAASKGRHLVLGINSDASVRRQNKGPERPINDEQSRALVVASLEVISLVVVFDNDTPLELIKFLQPTILAKGADYDATVTDENHPKYIVGSKEVKEKGGSVITIPLEEGCSTTNIVRKLKGS